MTASWASLAVCILLLSYYVCQASLVHTQFGRDFEETQNGLHRNNQRKNDIDSTVLCPTCEKLSCIKKTKLKCRGGLTSDYCGCCDICARLEGESCGSYFGKCDRNLFCQLEDVELSSRDYEAIRYPGKGRCVSQPEETLNGMILDTLTLADEARKDPPREAIICQPKCTSDFCSKNPRAICSAEDNADQSKSCQETCQHTSCSACRFLQSVPRPCPHCAKDDFKCIKQFGRCIRKQNCRRRKFPCVSKGLAAKEDFGKFQCSVPDCPVE